MSLPCMQTACSTAHVLMYVNVINSWIIIITLLVSKESQGEKKSGHRRAFSMKGLMCSLSYCNASVNINAIEAPALPLAAATVHLIKEPKRT